MAKTDLTLAERQARHRQRVVTFRPQDKTAFDAAASAAGVTPPQLAARIIDHWLATCTVPAPMVSAAQLEAAALLDGRRRNLLTTFADILHRAASTAALDRIERRLAILNDLPA